MLLNNLLIGRLKLSGDQWHFIKTGGNAKWQI